MIVTDVGEKWVSPRFFAFLGEWGWGKNGAAPCGYRRGPAEGWQGSPNFSTFSSLTGKTILWDN